MLLRHNGHLAVIDITSRGKWSQELWGDARQKDGDTLKQMVDQHQAGQMIDQQQGGFEPTILRSATDTGKKTTITTQRYACV